MEEEYENKADQIDPSHGTNDNSNNYDEAEALQQTFLS